MKEILLKMEFYFQSNSVIHIRQNPILVRGCKMGFFKITFKIEFSPNSALICDYYGGRGANERALALYGRENSINPTSYGKVTAAETC